MNDHTRALRTDVAGAGPGTVTISETKVDHR
jgi:hypothetical protein